MTKQTINIGTSVNKGDGDPLRTAFTKINENFTELYNSTGGLDLSNITESIIPSVDNSYDLGSPTRQWRHVYTAGGSIYLDDIKLTNVGGKFVATKVINPGEENEAEDPEDSDASSEIGGAANLGNLKIESSTLGTQGADSNSWGNHNLYLDPGGESNAYISIPSVAQQESGAALQIYNKGDASSIVQVFGRGGVQVVTNTGEGEEIFEFRDDGKLQLPPGGDILDSTGASVLGGGSANGLTSNDDINITINNDDSSSYTWNYGNTGTLTLPNGQQIDAEDPNLLQIGSDDAGVRLNRLNQSTLLIAKKSFNRNFGDGGDWTITATAGPPHIVTVTFSPNVGLYFRQLLERLQIKLNFGGTDFIYDYSNVHINLNPEDQAVVANITSVSETNYDPLTYEITIDEDPTAVVGVLTDITISYDYNNTVGLDVEEDRFGIATDNDDIDIRSGRDIDLIAADDIFIQAGSLLEITLNRNDGQEDTDGIEISTNTGASNNVWRFGFDGDLDLPQDGGIVFDRNNTTIRVGMGFHIASGEGISLDAIDQTAILTLSGAGNGPVNQTYNKTNDTLYTGNDNSSVTVENLGGTWFVFIDGDAKYTSNDLIGWALSTGPGPVPVGVFSNGYKIWGFSPTGNLTLPNGAVIRTDGTNTEVGGMTNFNVEAAGVVNIYTDTNGETPYQWQFGDDGNLTLPAGGDILDSTGNSVLGGGGNTGNVTFSDQIVMGTGTNDGGGGLYLAPGPNSIADSAVQYLRVRGGDFPTHIHLDTGNNAYYDQYFGADSKYVKLEASGNIVINADDGANGATWTFDTNGDLTVPGGIKSSISNNLAIETESLPTNPPTTIVISGADFTSVNLTYTKDGANSLWYPAGYNPATDPYIEFTGGQYGIFVPGFNQALYVNTGTLNIPLVQWNTNPPLGSVAPTGVYTYSGTYTRAWTFGTNGNLTIPGGISSIDHLNLDADYDGGYSVYIGSNHPTAGMLGGVVLGDTRGGFVQVISQKLIVGETAVPTHSTGAVGDVEGQVAFDSNYIYYCTANYGQVGHQVTGSDYLGRASLNTNAFQLTKTADTLQITVGDIISDSDGGATSTVVTVSSDENYTYVGTGGLAYAGVFPFTFTSTDYVSGGNIWKRVAWSGDTW